MYRLLESVRFNTLIVENGIQTIKVSTFGELFDVIKSKEWHRDGNYVCPHEESLWDHLLDCAEACAEKAGELRYDVRKAYFAGLLHDIGKPGTVKKGGRYLSFKGHGLCGGAMIENMWSPAIEEIVGLSAEDWAEISMAADVHMCGYFEEQKAFIHRACFQMLPIGVRQLLTCLRYGDIAAMKCPERDDMLATLDHYEIYWRHEIMRNVEINKLGELYPKGILINMCGASGTGKSTLSSRIMNVLRAAGVDRCCIISRDQYMVRETMKRLGEEWDGVIGPEIYQKCIKHYYGCNKTYARDINNAMRADINDRLEQGFIVILDTLMTMYPGAFRNILPESASESFRMNIWTHRNELFGPGDCEERLGMTLEEQLDVFGSCSELNPFPSGVVWDNVISLTEGARIIEEVTRPHLSVSLGWNLDEAKFGLLETILGSVVLLYKENKNKKRLPTLEETMNYNLRELLEVLVDVGGFKAIKEFFVAHDFRVLQPYKNTKWEEKIIGVKYIDGKNNLWRPKWARECRGRFYYIGEWGCEEKARGSESVEHTEGVDERRPQLVIPLKDSLERGAEVLTHNHLVDSIKETQDMRADSISHFQDIQQDCIRAFAAENAHINAYITGKADGSLIVVNVYPRGSIQEQIMNTLIADCEDTPALELAKYCNDNGLPLITLSSQGTLLLGSDMLDYIVTSLQSVIEYGYSSVSDSDGSSKKKHLVYNIWKMICPDFCKLVMKFIGVGYRGWRLHMCFEAICANRVSIIGTRHPEMAVSYDHNGFIFLGSFVCGPLDNDAYYVPHFKEVQTVFPEPIYRAITETKEVFEIMNAMDDVVLGKMRKDDFIRKYFPVGEADADIHMEGWVLLTECGEELYDYSKIKTNMYYKCHKIRRDNLDWLLGLPLCCGDTYPVIGALHKCFDSFDDTLKETMREYEGAFRDQIRVDSPFYKVLSAKARWRVDDYINGGCEDVDAFDTIIKMVVNVAKDLCNELIKPINLRLWDNDNIALVMKQIFIKCECWKGEEKLCALLADKDNVLIKDLYTTLLYRMSPP